MFRYELLKSLDEKYDEIHYNIQDNILEITINKKPFHRELHDIMKDLCKEIHYPLRSFHSDNDKYTFTYQLMED